MTGGPANGVIVVIPTLNEAPHVGRLLDQLGAFMAREALAGHDSVVVVADGGSTDDTRANVLSHPAAAAGRVVLIDNVDRIQSAGLNHAVRRHGDGRCWLIRVDAHACYPDDYCDVLIAEAEETGADSVVVSMRAVGAGRAQTAIALAQNSPLGNGGASHRTGAGGHRVDHGHHALMRLDAFRAVGGYDPGFAHNEDAELDLRLGARGYQIWQTGRTGIDYIPRASYRALARQYARFGAGRAATMRKHRIRPKPRQLVVAALAPMVALVVLAPLWLGFALPTLVWIVTILFAAPVLARSEAGVLGGFLAALAAGVMHLAWSAGFWGLVPRTRPAVPRPPAEASPLRQDDRHAIGVCTFRRPGLADTLATLEAQRGPSGRLTILVADNDDTPTAQEAVGAFARTSRHEVVYLHAPAGNISVARNAILAAARARDVRFLAFIDDDETASPGWYRSLHGTLTEARADAAVGPVRAIYAADAPAWLSRARSHDTRPEIDRNGRPIAGHSCNVIVDLDAQAFAGLRFRPELGRTGGEDTTFFHAAQRRGAVLAFAAGAEVTEAVPPERARLGWLLRRRYRMGQTHGNLLAEDGGLGRARRAALASAKLGWCAVTALLALPMAAKRNTALVRGALHAGVVADAIGLRRIEPYGAQAGGIERGQGET